ncbi:nuclease-related domain-containing protein [Mesobacillus selenatarsenatis]|uniref:NERD domain-containing protein n=1 Tax=Mesobacillus selenatarsenatis TaxID=388741 RepID=A0A846TMC5_9BACI|nr:nuclease-related domain-containing protein [Mesobacillus selenatarsenatis]NKE07929.1 NERD domain-containing protein [Mesobacillus selenatarsenatis]
MILKTRYEPDELKIMNLLEPRMNFTEKEKQRHYRLRKGYEGEVKYDRWMKSLEIQNLTLNDLLLEASNTTFQIDSSVITQNKLLLFEVKDFEGEYYYEDERLKIIYGEEIKDPLLQLKRNTSLFRQLLASLGFHLEIESYVLFINPEFTLYQAPKNSPIILPSQLNRFMKKLNKRQSKLNNIHQKIADKLLELHTVDNPYKRLPKYEYEQLKKGIVCGECHSFVDLIVKREFVCSHCGSTEKIDTAVLRSVADIKLLFPDKKVTTALIHEWCNGVVSLKSVRRILLANLEPSGERNTRYFL